MLKLFKNNKIKRYLSSALAVVAVAASAATGMFAYANDNIAITKANFNDDIWRSIVSTYLDYDSNGVLSPDEIEGTTFIDVSGFLEASYGEDTEIEISDLSGIEFFTSLRTLRVGGIGLEALDVSALTNLTSLTCQGNYLESIELGNNGNLKELNCAANFIESVDLSSLSELTRLICHTNMISSIDLSHSPKLEFLSIYQNELEELDLSSNPLISELNCASNHLRALDLSANPLLSDIVEASIGNQIVSASANCSVDGSIYADIEIPDSSRIVSTSLDRVEEIEDTVIYVKGYDGTSFVSFDMEQILGGADYYYDVNLAGAANMRVHVDFQRDFYLVRYYDSESLENKIGEEVVNGGNAATFELSELPQCKSLAGWSADISEINEDIQVYPIFADDHNMQITSFEDGVVYVICANGCGTQESYVFSEHINAREGDDNYVSALDINSDSIINAKDFARLLKGAY